MKVIDIIHNAATFLQLSDVCDALRGGTFDPSRVSEETAAETDLLVRCLNLVLSEVSADVFPVTGRAIVYSSDGVISYNELPAGVINVYSVEERGRRVRFSEFGGAIETGHGGTFTVTYSVRPAAVSISGRMPYPSNKPSERLMALGVAREYSLISGMTNEAAVWDARFVEACESESRPKNERIIRPRRWI